MRLAMTHNPELQAAAYLAGELSESAQQSFEDHLLRCDQCWSEVESGRRGQTAAESIREFAPAHLRAAIRRRVTNGAQRPRRRRTALYAAAALVLLAGISTAVVVALPPRDSSAVAAAVAGYTEGRLPGATMPKEPAPDLSSIRLDYAGAGAGRIGDMPVTAYAYRDAAGRRLVLYTSTKAFEMPPEAQLFDGAQGPWMTHRDGVMLLFSRHPHELLILGKDDELVHDAAVALDVM